MAYYMIRGRSDACDEQAEPIDAGQAVVIPAGSIKFISNTGEEDLGFLAIVDPMWDGTDEICIPCNR